MKMLLATALAIAIRDISNGALLLKQTGSNVQRHHPSFLRF